MFRQSWFNVGYCLWHWTSIIAGTVFRLEILTSIDARIWRLNSIPELKESQYLYWSCTHNIGIQMKRNELTKTFMMISSWKKSCSLGLYRNISVLSPADTRRWPNVGSMLGQRRRRWPSIKPTLGQRLVSAGKQKLNVFDERILNLFTSWHYWCHYVPHNDQMSPAVSLLLGRRDGAIEKQDDVSLY